MCHGNGIPKSFVYDEDGKFFDQSIDELTQKQLLMMLSRAGLKPAWAGGGRLGLCASSLLKSRLLRKKLRKRSGVRIASRDSFAGRAIW